MAKFIKEYHGPEKTEAAIMAIVATLKDSRANTMFSIAYNIATRATQADPALDSTDLYSCDQFLEFIADSGYEEEFFLDSLTTAFLDLENPGEFPLAHICAKLETSEFRVKLPRVIPPTPAYLALATAGYYLQDLAGTGDWFLSSRSACLITGQQHTQNAIHIKNLVRSGVFILTQKSTPSTAACYRYIHGGL